MNGLTTFRVFALCGILLGAGAIRCCFKLVGLVFGCFCVVVVFCGFLCFVFVRSVLSLVGICIFVVWCLVVVVGCLFDFGWFLVCAWSLLVVVWLGLGVRWKVSWLCGV